jgi:uncharacterized FlgJ-related protein
MKIIMSFLTQPSQRKNFMHSNTGLMLLSGVLILLALLLTALRKINSRKKMITLIERIINRCVKRGFTVLAAQVVVCQAVHETSVKGKPFASDVFNHSNNLFGMKDHLRNIAGRLPKLYKGYATYTDIESSIDDLIDLRRKRGIADKTENVVEYSTILKKVGYYEAKQTEYTSGMLNAQKKLFT